MNLSRSWRNYWFRPTPVVYLAILRICLVLAQLSLMLMWDVYNQDRIYRMSNASESDFAPLMVLSFLLSPFGQDFRPSLQVLLAIHWSTFFAGVMAFIGFRTNLSLGLFTLGNVFITAYWYSFFPIHHPEALTVMAFLFLALSPSGRVLSVDAWLRRQQMREKGMSVEGFSWTSLTKERSVYARWPLLLIWWLTGVMYLDAALTKFARSGLDWVNGYTLQFLQIEAGLEANSSLAILLGQQYLLSLILSWVTILFEATFFLVAILPMLALFYVPLGVALHMGMCVTSIACFWQYMALYTAFIPGILMWVPVFRSVLRRIGFSLDSRKSKAIGAESSV